MGYHTERYIEKTTAQDGTVTSSEVTRESGFSKRKEPDYVKIYTHMWLEFKSVSDPKYKELFMELIIRLPYIEDPEDPEFGVVSTGGITEKSICAKLGWKQRQSYLRGLKALAAAGCIKKVARAQYQINPSYALKGNFEKKWDKITGIIATFNIATGATKTDIKYTETAESNYKMTHPVEMDVKRGDTVTITETTTYEPEPEYEQTKISDFYDPEAIQIGDPT